MKRIGASLCVWFLLVSMTASAWQSAAQTQPALKAVSRDRPFVLSRHQAPDEEGQIKYERTHCANLENGLRVCKYITESETFFALERNGQRLGRWPAATYNGGTSRFEVLQGDLDGDRASEIVVADCSGVTNGIGFEYWTISILPDPEKHGFQQPLSFSVEEYGGEGTFVRHPGDKRCHIFATEWQELKYPGRKWGLYLTGRWFRYHAGLLLPIKERAVLARRYRFAFENERTQADEDAKKPLRWFQHRSTEIRRRDPQTIAQESSSLRGIVLGAAQSSDADGQPRLRVKVKLASGQLVEYVESPEGAGQEAQAKDRFKRLGDAPSGVVYPKGYAPADLPHWLAGKRVRVVTYQHEEVGQSRILWVAY